MKRMRFVLGLFIAVLLVIALAVPMAVLAQETAATTVAETSATETSVETDPTETSDSGDAVIELPDPDPVEQPPEDPIELPDPGPGEQPTESPAIGALIAAVEGLNLQQGIENSLDAKLQNAKDSLTAANAGLREDAVNKLQAFINACEAQRDKALTSEQADMLIDTANAIIASL